MASIIGILVALLFILLGINKRRKDKSIKRFNRTSEEIKKEFETKIAIEKERSRRPMKGPF